MEFLYLAIGLLLGCIITYLYVRYKYRDVVYSQQETESLRSRVDSLNTEKAKTDAKNTFLEKSLEQALNDLTSERSKVLELNSTISKLTADYSNLENRLKEQREEVESLQKKFTTEFENLANRILDEKSKKFTEQNKSNIDEILKPLSERIKDFEKKVNDIHLTDLRERASLAEQLKNLHELNKQMTEEANNLTKALKGESKTQGTWGEFILENILEKSGLVRDREYSMQSSFVTEEGRRQRPDVIIHLPEDRHMIIDSKVSLTSYERFSSLDNGTERQKELNEHILSVRKHLKELSLKNYHKLYDLQNLDFVLMFVPIEPAFAIAVQNDPNLFYDAFEMNIVIVSPSTLLATLRTIANIWKQEKQNKNAMEIAKQSGELYDKFIGFVEDLLSLGKNLDSTNESYERAMNKLKEGRGNLIKRAENIKELGAKTSKSIPQVMIEGSDEEHKQLE